MDEKERVAIPVAEVFTYGYDLSSGNRPQPGDPVRVDLPTSIFHGRKAEFVREVRVTEGGHEWTGVIRVDGNDLAFGPCLEPWVRSLKS